MKSVRNRMRRVPLEGVQGTCLAYTVVPAFDWLMRFGLVEVRRPFPNDWEGLGRGLFDGVQQLWRLEG